MKHRINQNRTLLSPIYRLTTLLLFGLISTSLSAQVLEGRVMGFDDKGAMYDLPGANVLWLGETSGVVTDDAGHFEIQKSKETQRYLVISYVGFVGDTIDAQSGNHFHIMLNPATELQTVVVEGEHSSRTINTVDPIGSEQLNKKELLKAACCNLSESFETNNSVDAEFSDAVTGAKTIKLLGLDGVYAQIMTENMSSVRGLSSAYGLTFIPGPWIESIQITKGPGSVVNGYEGITGSINTELKKPFDADEELASINLFGSNSGRWEANALYKHLFNDKWSTALYAHTSQLHNEMDHNNDTFLDMPLTNTIALMNKWNYFSGKKHEAQFGVKYISSSLTGGQTTFNPDEAHTVDNGYGVGVDIQRWEAFMKNGFVFDRPSTSIGTILQFSSHNQTSFFGLNNYTGKEIYGKAEFIFVTYLGSTNNTIKTGLNYLYDDFDETYDSVAYLRTESVPGIFAEYAYIPSDKFSLLAGLRADQHNLYGTFITPRLHLKYQVAKQTTLRASAGRGYRTANIFAENTNILTSNRTLEITAPLEPEVGWNYGVSLVQQFSLFHRDATFTLDGYRTDFENQVVVDVDADPHKILIYNLDGSAFSNVAQAEFSFQPAKNFEVRSAYKYIDSRSTYQGLLEAVPLTYNHRGLVNLAYNWKKAGFLFDMTAQGYGASRLPDLSENHAAHGLGTTSEPYMLLLAQITKTFGDLEIYAGSDNLTNYTQHMPIIGYDEPFGENFDAGVIYAPVMERKFYGGLRYTFN